ncbi:MAG: alpha/beta hydrolase [Deltaproteobacteria bacterium]|nr:alpha/beta hydrolase [Deltaproteobacteria bacterium]
MNQPPVLLLHGLARTRISLAGLDRSLRAAEHRTWARTYPSRRQGVAELAEQVATWIEQDLGEGPFDAVTHSLGGVLVRHMAERVPLRRVVMLAPPNAGSDLARSLERFGPFSWLYGPAGRDVARGEGWPAALRAEVAVIAGTRAPSLGNPVSWLSRGIGVFHAERPSDGTVAVDETHLPGMTDFATVHASHTWIMNHPEVRAMVLRFLAEGRLQAGAPA